MLVCEAVVLVLSVGVDVGVEVVEVSVVLVVAVKVVLGGDGEPSMLIAVRASPAQRKTLSTHVSGLVTQGSKFWWAYS